MRRRAPMVTISLGLDVDTYNLLVSYADQWNVSMSAAARALINGKLPEPGKLTSPGGAVLRENYAARPADDGHAMTAEERREFFAKLALPPDPPEEV